jgi:predicted phage terminase large subunit-like protein
MMNKKYNDKDIADNIANNPKIKRALAKASHYWFFHLYLTNYIQYQTAQFQKELFAITEDEAIKNAVIVAFRGSAKSTIMSLSYPIWAMIGAQKKKHIIILTQTQQLCRLILTNIRHELENNLSLIKDFGPFKQISEEWNQNALTVSAYACRIAVVSCGEPIRGIRYHESRPDLLIFDDVEDLASVKTKEGRDKTFYWFDREVIPSADVVKSKTIIIGNMLHEDSLMMKLKKAILDGIFSALYRQIPLLDSLGNCLWPGKFPTKASIDNLKKNMASETTFEREFLLKYIPDSDSIINREHIVYYDSFPQDLNFKYIATGIDLAISKDDRADFTAMVSARVYGNGENIRIYIYPWPLNQRLNSYETEEKIKWLSKSLGGGHPTRLFIESVGYQQSLIENLCHIGYPAEAFKVMGRDKRERLMLTVNFIRNGNILFPRKGCEQLISQLTGFGYESHDDLADAFAILILKIQEKNEKEWKLLI